MPTKNYLIIGASSGIGQQLANSLAQAGHQVYGTYHSHPVQNHLPNLEYHALDVLAEQLNLDFLPATLDGLVYCPGSINLKPFARIKPEDFTHDFELQVGGAIKVLQAVLPKLKATTAPAVVFFSTVAVQLGFNFHSQVAVSKGALEGLTQAEISHRLNIPLGTVKTRSRQGLQKLRCVLTQPSRPHSSSSY